MKHLSPKETYALMQQGIVYVDVRTPEEFAEGRPSGAINIPVSTQVAGVMTPNPNFVAEVAAKFSPETQLILGCRSGARSKRAGEALEQAGFTNIVEQRAGFSGSKNAFGGLEEQGWADAGLPVEKT